MKKYLTLIAGALMMAACSNDDATTEVTQSGDAIGFSAATEELNDVTRAVGEINDVATLATKDFGVFGFYTGKVSYLNSTVTPDYMWNQKMKGALVGTEYIWSYEPAKYWPNADDEKISFFAYAPYQQIDPNHPVDPADKEQCIIGMSRNVDKGDAWVNYRMAENPWGANIEADPLVPNQVDLLYGVKREGTSAPYTYSTWTDQKKTDYKVNEKIKFQFEHALACVGDKVTLCLSDELKALITGYSELTINKLTINYNNFTYKAKLSLNPTIGAGTVEPNWKEIISGELTCDRELVAIYYPKTSSTLPTLASITPAELLATSKADPTTWLTLSEGQGLFYIPMQVAGTPDAVVSITIDYTIKIIATGVTFDGTATNSFKLKEQATNTAMTPAFAGNKLGIALTLGKDFDLLHEVWVLGGTAYEPSYSRIMK